MKQKAAVIVFAMIFAGLLFAALPQTPQSNEDFLRIHIRANSNASADQTVKYRVKEEIVNYLAPFLTAATDKASAQKIVAAQLKGIERTADRVLLENGFQYRSRAAIKREEFPVRQYETLVLCSGVYDALILNLGSGTGDNWWCVVYPPLCFVGGELNGTNRIHYKSKLMERIEQFRIALQNKKEKRT